MSRRPKAELSQNEVESAISKRRSDAFPIIGIPFSLDARHRGCAFLICLFGLLRREQLWRVREILRRSKRPEILAKQNLHNFLPVVELRRKETYNSRYHEDVEFRRKENRRGVERFKANKAKIYTYRRAHPEIYGYGNYHRNWQRNRRQNDPQYNVGNRLRSRLWHAIAGKALKAAKTEDLVGCTVAQLRGHLEKQFSGGMTWEKFLRGEIHLDHKRPCASFDLTDPEQQRLCFHYTNLQPLWAVDNLSKSNFVTTGDGIRVRAKVIRDDPEWDNLDKRDRVPS